LAQYRKSSELERSDSSLSSLEAEGSEKYYSRCKPIKLPHNPSQHKKYSKWSNIGGIMLEESFESE